MDKSGITSYVFVPNELPGGSPLLYYKGYFMLKYAGKKPILVAALTNNYSEAIKVQFKDEAETICQKINDHSMVVKFHVEDHMYM